MPLSQEHLFISVQWQAGVPYANILGNKVFEGKLECLVGKLLQHPSSRLNPDLDGW